MTCDHSNYDEYFDECTDCKLDGFSVHKEMFPDHFMKAVDDSKSYECQDCEYEGIKGAA